MRFQRLFFCMALLGASTLTACGDGSNTSVTNDVNGDGNQIAANSFDMTLISPVGRQDGAPGDVPITMTVFIPARQEGASYPLILHSHGFGGSRVSAADANAAGQGEPESIDSTTSFFTRIDQQVRLLWDAGYAVVSFDERGFGRGDDGDSQTDEANGAAQIIDPDFEIQDAIAVLDWADQNLNLARDNDGNPLVGSIGGSYGGGYQLLLAALDDRVDAIVPGATWYNLLQSLLPNDVIKKAYSTGLCVLAQSDMAQLGTLATSACSQASDQQPSSRYLEDIQVMNQELQDFFFTHGLVEFERRHDDPNDAFTMRGVDALLIQGNRDILFNLNQAFNNYRFLNSLPDADVRLLTHENGHSIAQTRQLGGSQGPLGPSACGPLDGLAALRAFFDLKLRGDNSAAARLPDEVCISLDDNSGVALDSVPVAAFDDSGFDPFSVTIASTDITSMANNTQSVAGGVFVPLDSAIQSAGQVLVGQPIARITVSDTLADPNNGTTAFIGIGIQRDGSTILVDDQVQPVRASDPRTGDAPSDLPLVGVGEALQPGDQLGVLIYGSFDQYEPGAGTPTNFSTSNNVTVSGSVRLPVISVMTQSRD